jgi:hypothetical protein
MDRRELLMALGGAAMMSTAGEAKAQDDAVTDETVYSCGFTT